MAVLSSILALVMLAGPSDTGSRRVMLFAPDASDSRLLDQQNIFKADSAGLSERQIVVTVSVGSSDKSSSRSGTGTGKGFLFVLYGKDGGKKYTSDKPVTLYKLFGIIDSMPMRAEEMKQESKR